MASQAGGASKRIFGWRGAPGDRHGSVSTMMALTAVPLVIALGIGIDLSRLGTAKAALQHAADSAALAGATVYQSDQMQSSAQTAANNYFDHFAQGMDAVVSSRAAAAAPGQIPGGGASYNVTVDATATMPMTLMAIANVGSMTITAHAVAANNAAGLSSQPWVSVGSAGSSAWDWNSAYMYGVPFDTSGKPDYTKFPPFTEFYEVASNCGNITDGHGNTGNGNWSQQSRCNGHFGAIVPATQNFPKVLATQPLAFMFFNMNNGEISPGDQGYGPNQYGAAPGNIEVLNSASMALNQSPSQNTDSSITIVHGLVGNLLSQVSTHYSTVNRKSRPDCALQIQQVDPNNLPQDPPYPGMCFSTSDVRSGSQYANLSCSQIAGRTFMYWWNDMGGSQDDFDYKNLYFTVTCKPGSTDPNGGNLYTGTPPNTASANVAVMLIQ